MRSALDTTDYDNYLTMKEEAKGGEGTAMVVEDKRDQEFKIMKHAFSAVDAETELRVV